MNKIKREVPIKNYIILSGVILVSLLLLFYFYLWYLTYEESKLNTQIIDRYLQVINYNELNDYILENKDAYVYVSVLEDSNIRDFELKFKTLIIDNSLKDKILYLDLTEINNDKKAKDEASKKYQVVDKSILDIPCLLVFKKGNLEKIYDIKETNYDTNSLLKFLKKEGVVKDD